MCLNIYIASEKELPLIPWNEEQPGLCIDAVTDPKEINRIELALHAKHYYDAGSFMGCACGFSYGKWSEETNDNHELRIKDIRDLKKYLQQHSDGNFLQLFCTWWHDFPEVYPTAEFPLSEPEPEAFDFEEDIVLTVVS